MMQPHKKRSLLKKTTAFFLIFVMLASSGLSTFANELSSSTNDDSQTNAEASIDNTARASPIEEESETVDDEKAKMTGDNTSYSVYVMDAENGTIYVNGEATDYYSKSQTGVWRRNEIVGLEDTISYSGLIAGKQYYIKGYCYNKETNELMASIGIAFTPNTSTGTVAPYRFTLNSATLGKVITKETSVVAFEEIYSDWSIDNNENFTGTLIASHCDINDAKQTVTYPIYPVKVIKYDEDGNPGKGVEVEITNKDGTVTDKGTTDEHGEITFYVPPDTYDVTDTDTDETTEVEVQKEVTVEFKNPLISLPQTGGKGTWDIDVLAFGILICSIPLLFASKKKRQ